MGITHLGIIFCIPKWFSVSRSVDEASEATCIEQVHIRNRTLQPYVVGNPVNYKEKFIRFFPQFYL